MTATAYLARELSRPAAQALKALPVLVVTGLRQAGKTTFLRNDPAFRGRRYLSLDDFATLEAARREPEALLAGDEPLILDEVQRCPELLVAVKRAVDRRRLPGRFVLSGSANLDLMAGVSESLAGRAVSLVLHPFTRREAGRAADPPFLVRLLETGSLPRPAAFQPVRDDEVLGGGLPPVVLGERSARGLWFLGYEQTYLERDVRNLAQVGDLVAFRSLLRLASLRTAQLLNQSELARDAKLPVSTVSRHLGLLETSFVVTRLTPHLRNRSTRLVKSPKLFVSDSGLAAHLTDVSGLGPADDEPLRGALYETFAHQNLAGLLSDHLERAELCFWNVQGRHEVDFVVVHRRRTVAIEVKAATRFGDSDLSGLRAFVAATPGVVAGILAYNGAEVAPLGDKLFAVPLGLLLS
jgi:predicted AAA+ superfamily ATPase